MKTVTIFVAALAASLFLSAMPAFSAEDTMWEENQGLKKDVCLLFAMNCQDNTYMILQRIDLLQREIAKGTTVYSPAELDILRQKLDDASRALEFLNREGA
jgi:hypothetical protein